MTQMTHPELVVALVKPGHVIADELSASDADLWHAATGIAGETTEVLEAAIKTEATKTGDRPNMVEELGDLEFYAEQLRTNRGITRDEVIACEDGAHYFSADPTAAAACLAVSGGVLLDLAKRVAIYRKPVVKQDFVAALAYFEACLRILRDIHLISREETLEGNIAKLTIRYGKTYSDTAAVARADKQEDQ